MSLPNALSIATFARSNVETLLKDFPAARWTHQPAPTDNHALWTVGHLASTDAWLGSLLGAPGVSMPEGYDKLFGMGSKPVGDAKAYPAPESVLAVMRANRAAVLDWFAKASPADLARPLSDKTGGFMTDPVDGLAKIAWHDGWHGGQLAGIRKSLGLPNVFG
ncbi:MAG: DinB family protein [Planctomycetota bacterium]|nr:DinB family protein [Planctomycetota bacterium]